MGRPKKCRFSDKVKFDSHEKAAIRAGELLQVHTEVKAYRTYKCHDCGKWHLTTEK